MTTESEEKAPNPATPTVTHAPATRLESGEILSSPEDHERHAEEQADGAGETLEELNDG